MRAEGKSGARMTLAVVASVGLILSIFGEKKQNRPAIQQTIPFNGLGADTGRLLLARHSALQPVPCFHKIKTFIMKREPQLLFAQILNSA